MEEQGTPKTHSCSPTLVLSSPKESRLIRIPAVPAGFVPSVDGLGCNLPTVPEVVGVWASGAKHLPSLARATHSCPKAK